MKDYNSLKERKYLLLDYEGVIGPKIQDIPEIFGNPDAKGPERELGVYGRLIKIIMKNTNASFDEAKRMRVELLKKYNVDDSSYTFAAEFGVDTITLVNTVILPEVTNEETSNVLAKYVKKDPGLNSLLKATKIPKAILSNTSKEFVNRALEAQGFSQVFNPIITLEDLKMEIKPRVEAYKKAIKETGWRAEKSIYVDDKIENLAEPKKLGFATVLISDKEGDKSIADYFFASLKDLLSELSD
jgi:HAD superfamily hydrolase (TIGR01509 family)